MLGDGTQTDQPVPQLVAGGTLSWKSLPSRGFDGYQTCAILANGTLACWGYNSNGQLGDGTIVNNVGGPKAVLGGGNYTMVETGAGHTCGIQIDASLYCWGRNDYGQVGVGSTINKLVPTRVWYGGEWSVVRAGNFHTCGIRTNGQLWCFGYNNHGQVGDATLVQKTVPTQIGVSANWTSLALGELYSCGINATGSISCWVSRATPV